MTLPTFHHSTNDPDRLETGVLHLGFGAFHRAHQAEYFDRYMERTGEHRWGITAINLRAADSASFAAAAGCEGYVLRRLSADGAIDDRLIRCHAGFLDWVSDAGTAEKALAQPSVTAVTMTVTEAGYNLDGKGQLNLDDPQIRAEIDGGAPTSVYGFLTAALRARADEIDAPVSLLNCDNIRRNGKMLQQNLQAYLHALGEQALSDWIEQRVTFPCSMVDRITPQPSAQHHSEVSTLYQRAGTLGVTIHAEDFIQWVLEDRMAADFPDLRPDGVTFTDDVDPYEETKIRVLNGGHTALAYLGALAGFDTFDEVMNHPKTADHFARFEREEVTRALPDALPFDVEDYVDTVSRRFSNQHIADSVERIVSDGFAKFPIFIRPTVRGCLEQGHIPECALRSIASWYHFTRQSLSGAAAVPYREPNLHHLQALMDDEAPTEFVESSLLWGDLGERFPQFRTELTKAIQGFNLG